MSDPNFAEGIDPEQGGVIKRFCNKMSIQSKRTKIILIATIVSLLILISVLLIVLITVEAKASRISCDLSEERPPMEPVKYFKSDNNRALVSFSGYIKYEVKDTKKVFAPISLERVEADRLIVGTSLRLVAGCANIEMMVVLLSDSNSLKISEVRVDLGRYGPHSNICILQNFDVIIYSYDHYSCERSFTYDCTKDGDLIAQIIINRFEYELDGDPKKVADYKFSTEAESC